MRITCAAILIAAFFSLEAEAVPRYSVMYNQSCVLCHVDPSGGGARSLYGAQFFAYTELGMKGLALEELGKVQPMLNDQIQIGVDARTQFYGIDSSGYNTFMAMQGNLYLNFQLNPIWNFYLNKGLYAGFEVYGLGHILPHNGYVKVGRFTPPYGLRLADHKAFIREPLGLGMGWYESGMEVGFHPQNFTFAVAVTNGTTGFQSSGKGKAVTGRTDIRMSLGEANLWVGVTGRYNEEGQTLDRIGGVYGGVGLGRLFVLAEADYHHSLPLKELCSYVEVSALLRQGLLLKLEHDFHDPNLDVTSGTENMYVFGAEIVPTGFLQLIPNVRFHDIKSGPEYSGNDYYEGEIQFHVFF